MEFKWLINVDGVFTCWIVQNSKWSVHFCNDLIFYSFLDSLVKISAENYLPDVQDIIQCRFPTIGTEEIEFRYQDMDFSLVDVGGQRTERRKWLNFFDNVQMMLFVAALSDYDLQDAEDAAQVWIFLL